MLAKHYENKKFYLCDILNIKKDPQAYSPNDLKPLENMGLQENAVLDSLYKYSIFKNEENAIGNEEKNEKVDLTKGVLLWKDINILINLIYLLL